MSDIFGKKVQIPNILNVQDDSWKMKVWLGKTPADSRVFTPGGEELKSILNLVVEQDAESEQTLLTLKIYMPLILDKEPEPLEGGYTQAIANADRIEGDKCDAHVSVEMDQEPRSTV